VVVLDVVRVAEVHQQLGLATGLHREVAELDGLRIVLVLVRELQQHLVAVRPVRFRHARRTKRGFKFALGFRVLLEVHIGHAAVLVDREFEPLGLLALDGGVDLAHLREHLVPLLLVGRLFGGPQDLLYLLRDLLIRAGRIRSRGLLTLGESARNRAEQAECDESRPKSPSF
jgi:hypothetical protein